MCIAGYCVHFSFKLHIYTGITFNQDGKKYAVLSVYMPYECKANEDKYNEKLGVLHDIFCELQTSCVSILGDWNADTSDRNSEFGRHIKLFCSDINLIISDESILPDDTFTHMSERWHTISWHDHCVSSGDGHTVIKNMAVLYSACCNDHYSNYCRYSDRLHTCARGSDR